MERPLIDSTDLRWLNYKLLTMSAVDFLGEWFESEQLIDVKCVADGQRGAVHDLQVAAGPGQPMVLRVVLRQRWPTQLADVVGNGRNDPRAILAAPIHDDLDVLQISAALADGRNAAGVIADFGSEVGSSVFLDFGNGDVLKVNNMTLVDLEDDISIV